MYVNISDLLKKLELIIYHYIEDEEFAKELVRYIEPRKIKYVLAELDKNKKKSYSEDDIELIKDIYFYYC